MNWRTVQPNGKLAVWDTVVATFGVLNATPKQIAQHFVERYDSSSLVDFQIYVKSAKAMVSGEDEPDIEWGECMWNLEDEGDDYGNQPTISQVQEIIATGKFWEKVR